MWITPETPHKEQQCIQTFQDDLQEKNKCPIVSNSDLQKLQITASQSNKPFLANYFFTTILPLIICQ